MRPAPTFLASLDDAVEVLLARVPGPLHVGAPLGLGKPHRLLNALYHRVAADPTRPLHLYTALSLDPPEPGEGLQARFLAPFVRRHFGDEFPRLAYVEALRRDALPAHVEVEEFYLQSGALLGSPAAQRRYTSLNYTHVARALAERGLNAIVQKVAREPGDAPPTRLSLSCNTDVTLDALDAVAARGLPRPLLIAEIDPSLPWLGGSAAVPTELFDVVVEPPGPHPQLFGLPRQPVADADYAIGFHASTLVRDGGTLQIGIGALADALSHALVLRHTDNATYRAVLRALGSPRADDPALAPFAVGLYGCSEMINEGFRRLVQVGVVGRKVVDDLAVMQRVEGGSADADDLARLARDGEYLHGAFYLGSPELYAWLRALPDAERRAIGMRRVSAINDLDGPEEPLKRLQRREARFFNTCMMATALGAATSDALDGGRVVSGVGGQYNFVAMAHAMPDARSILLLRAIRDSGGRTSSNVVWSYGHTTIPRHLRDVYVSEYGIADVRGKADEDCVIAMAAIADARFQAGLLAAAEANLKLRRGFTAPGRWADNTPEALRERLAPHRAAGALPDYPLGSDFTPVEQRLARALGWLKAHADHKLHIAVRAMTGAATDDFEALQRMQLDRPQGAQEWLQSRLLGLALRMTA
ncbi:acetyl-CoA hydrolase/transferase C-terminal domain-containing protein [Nannocystis bainbridge]|uniref:Acetyl-CoA hydrolase/transferase C-terminal domain-containing protein n=1 Tax=Nannocystis bainbridge TaxID=2995303 RepID=A0ABT5DPL6_9BACT|nr:acetyl-CoA hydrolase/transferase C-terminal domain-containing protein [Nannocystis bainbridge]MDC0715597.1 acetyl-CoA hydrolase/transferase C-terminal domain-containing protein [Nannocystis bainbridge]